MTRSLRIVPIGVLLISLLVIGLVMVGCGVRIETGQTNEEAVASSETRARGIRSNWARRVDNTAPGEVANLLRNYVDSTSGSLLDYGWRLEERWLEGNAGRGEAIPDNEIHEVIDSWIGRERPILKAWEDNIEYTWELIRQQAYYDERQMNAIQGVIDQYYSVYSGVMYPNGTVEDYGDWLRSLQIEMESVSQNLFRELE
ncbi:MAG: hypothetical protein KOO62_11885 [candidate division Zixibacteria bacterium]|nr:hypothetical protein [candidate division Zixibacteria bacterium]